MRNIGEPIIHLKLNVISVHIYLMVSLSPSSSPMAVSADHFTYMPFMLSLFQHAFIIYQLWGGLRSSRPHREGRHLTKTVYLCDRCTHSSDMRHSACIWSGHVSHFASLSQSLTSHSPYQIGCSFEKLKLSPTGQGENSTYANLVLLPWHVKLVPGDREI